MKQCVVILLVLVSAVLAVERSPKELSRLYKKTCKEYHQDRGLQSKEDDKEHYLSFVNYVNAVDKHNEEDGEHWKAAVNEFATMTPSERGIYLGLNASGIIEMQRRSLARRSALVVPLLEKRADSVDYSNKLPGIKHQGSCGSCWTFGAVAALEYQVNRGNSNLKALSEQQYLDCVYEGQRDGCNGGWPAECYTWTKNNGNMIASMADYPYVARDGACKTNVDSAISGFSVGGTRVLATGDDNMLAAVADRNIGVISCAIGVVDSFFRFSSGVYRETGCSRINHAVDVVGYGTLGRDDYWKVRNSWGSNWGDKGYINMLRGSNTCAISSHGHYPLVSGSDDDSDDGDDGDDNKKTCKWITKKGLKMKKKIGANMTKKAAMAKCETTKECEAITCKSDKKCWMNAKKKGKDDERFTGYQCKSS